MGSGVQLMATGDKITRANISKVWVTQGTLSGSSYSTSTTPVWMYICSPKCHIYAKTSYQAFGNSAFLIVTGWKRVGNSWVELFHRDYVDGRDSESLAFSHNYRESDAHTSATYQYGNNPSDDDYYNNIIKLRFECNRGDHDNWRVDYWADLGIGHYTQEIYDSKIKGHKILCCGGVGSTVAGSGVYIAGQIATAPDETALRYFESSHYRGSHIYGAYSHKLQPKE